MDFWMPEAGSTLPAKSLVPTTRAMKTRHELGPWPGAECPLGVRGAGGRSTVTPAPAVAPAVAPLAATGTVAARAGWAGMVMAAAGMVEKALAG